MKVAIVTGGTRGIGKATAIKLNELGYKVYAFYKSNTELAEEINSKYPAIIFRKIDILDLIALRKEIQKIVKKEHKIDILVNNAGICNDRKFLFMSDNAWDSVLETNLKGSFNVTKTVSKFMLGETESSIISISSVATELNPIGQSNYCVAKSGIESLSRVLAKELAEFNVRVNTVSPGYIKTDMTKNINENIVNTIPLQKLGTAEDVANLISFLISSEAGYITGQNFIIDGGLSC